MVPKIPYFVLIIKENMNWMRFNIEFQHHFMTLFLLGSTTEKKKIKGGKKFFQRKEFLGVKQMVNNNKLKKINLEYLNANFYNEGIEKLLPHFKKCLDLY